MKFKKINIHDVGLETAIIINFSVLNWEKTLNKIEKKTKKKKG